jgi:hypothetical protein
MGSFLHVPMFCLVCKIDISAKSIVQICSMEHVGKSYHARRPTLGLLAGRTWPTCHALPAHRFHHFNNSHFQSRSMMNWQVENTNVC